jgi:hypothetical protein
MECAECGTRVTAHAALCPRCGAPLAGTHAAAESGAGIVESTAERGPVSAELPLPPESDAESAGAPMGAADASFSDTRLVVSRTDLPAVLWRQPAVRAVAQAGAGAIALTLGMRLLRAWLARPRGARAVGPSALPLVADLLHPTDSGGGASLRGERGTEVMETFIYIRRVIRRH